MHCRLFYYNKHVSSSCVKMIIASFVILQLQWAYSCSLPVNDEVVVVLTEGSFCLFRLWGVCVYNNSHMHLTTHCYLIRSCYSIVTMCFVVQDREKLNLMLYIYCFSHVCDMRSSWGLCTSVLFNIDEDLVYDNYGHPYDSIPP